MQHMFCFFCILCFVHNECGPSLVCQKNNFIQFFVQVLPCSLFLFPDRCRLCVTMQPPRLPQKKLHQVNFQKSTFPLQHCGSKKTRKTFQLFVSNDYTPILLCVSTNLNNIPEFVQHGLVLHLHVLPFIFRRR